MMNKAATTVLLSMILFAGACTGNSKPGWKLDVQKSKVTWSTPKKMMGGHYGYFLFKAGNLEFSAAGEPIKGTFQMDMNSIRTLDNPTEAGNKKKEGEMRLPQFFDSDKHPVATMEVKKITPIDASKNYQVEGDLTIKSVTQPIKFTATIDTESNTSHITATIDIAHILWEIGAKKHDQARLDSLSAVRETLVPYVHVLLDITMVNKK
jgi:polyisoprenoid-binding protein YceI